MRDEPAGIIPQLSNHKKQLDAYALAQVELAPVRVFYCHCRASYLATNFTKSLADQMSSLQYLMQRWELYTVHISQLF